MSKEDEIKVTELSNAGGWDEMIGRTEKRNGGIDGFQKQDIHIFILTKNEQMRKKECQCLRRRCFDQDTLWHV